MNLQNYADRLDAELHASAEQTILTALNSYGETSATAARELYAAVFAEPAHWSGLLTLVGYALEAGQDDAMIIQAARAMELLRASATLHGMSAMTGREQAYMTIANLDGATEGDRLKAISICSRSTMLQAHGAMPAAFFINPMHVGMVLAGADCSATDDITPFVKMLSTAPDQAEQRAQLLKDRWPAAPLLQELTALRRLDHLTIS